MPTSDSTTERTTHTSGPWTVIETPTTIGIRAEGEYMTVAEMHKVNIGPRQSEAYAEALADARLIAAAPDLLEVAVDAEDWLDNHGAEDDPGAQGLLKMFRAAIAKATGAVLLLLLVAASAFAQERPSLARPLAVYVAGAVLDVHSTYRALHYRGVQERNPLTAWADARPATFVAVAAAEDAAIVWALHRWLAPTRPRLFRVGLYAVGALRVGLAARNYRVDPSRERVR